ncbi:uncharacterized protein OE_1978A1F [Halobacterium salinarum R1]|uniref:Uncharacterized protein n=4 Tax=Halobacterium salinarum TaxID=2242 RepID=A0A510N569_HALSA|nr:uncharacterized protein HBSAL_03560 [Halobacterium salinarum]CAP13422.2 uncharacterized protein OE_1978A1F [Halobacterium salinarum R1]DAC77858.1 TPA_inf: uncharacterized protein VNG_0656a [Halobacterium salinarum NRC-1]
MEDKVVLLLLFGGIAVLMFITGFVLVLA